MRMFQLKPPKWIYKRKKARRRTQYSSERRWRHYLFGFYVFSTSRTKPPSAVRQ